MSNFWGLFFHFFGVKKFFLNFFENNMASALKSCIRIYKKKIKNFFFDLEKVKKPVFVRAKNAIVTT